MVITVKPEDASYALFDPTFEREVPEQTEVIHTPSREIFNLYRRLFRKENLPTGGFANEDHPSFAEKASRFIRGNFFIPDPRKGWNRFALRAASSRLEKEEFHCVITSSPPHSTQLIGRKLHRKFKIPWLADLRDPWTDIYYFQKLYPTLPARMLHLRCERSTLKRADRIMTVGPALKQLLQQKHALPEGKVAVLPNGFDEEDFQSLSPPRKEDHLITYVGTLSDQYPIDGFVDAMSQILTLHPQVRIRFVGSVSSQQRMLLETLPHPSVEYLPHVSHSRALEYMMQSGILLLVIPRHSSSRAIITGKLFEYLASGTSILGLGPPDGDAADIVHETGRGRFVEYEDTPTMIAFVNWILEGNITDEGIPAAVSRYSRKSLSRELSLIMDALTEE